jgi:ubiquinone/menaquinone biosynthesis C-methylase UbiE
MDNYSEFKAAQRKGWASFAPLAAVTTGPAGKLVAFARVQSGQRVLDVGCGTGVVAVTAARAGARVSGLDLTPELLEVARENAQLAGVQIDFREGDAEALPFDDGAFDVVLSQFGHMFAPRPEVAVREMLRVLRPGGTVAFSTWPPELFTGRMFALTSRYAAPPPAGVAPPPQWGDPNVVRERLGAGVRELTFDRATMNNPALSPAHHRMQAEQFAAPIKRLVETGDPEKVAQYRKEYEALVAEYLEGNVVRQDFLMTRAIKA